MEIREIREIKEVKRATQEAAHRKKLLFQTSVASLIS